jgi:hypothetical protein
MQASTVVVRPAACAISNLKPACLVAMAGWIPDRDSHLTAMCIPEIADLLTVTNLNWLAADRPIGKNRDNTGIRRNPGLPAIVKVKKT